MGAVSVRHHPPGHPNFGPQDQRRGQPDRVPSRDVVLPQHRRPVRIADFTFFGPGTICIPTAPVSTSTSSSAHFWPTRSRSCARIRARTPWWSRRPHWSPAAGAGIDQFQAALKKRFGRGQLERLLPADPEFAGASFRRRPDGLACSADASDRSAIPLPAYRNATRTSSATASTTATRTPASSARAPAATMAVVNRRDYQSPAGVPALGTVPRETRSRIATPRTRTRRSPVARGHRLPRSPSATVAWRPVGMLGSDLIDASGTDPRNNVGTASRSRATTAHRPLHGMPLHHGRHHHGRPQDRGSPF